MIIRADHVAGGVFIALGLLVFAVSGDLPFGRISAPGAGMMPKLMAGLILLFAVIIVATGRERPPLARIDWSDWTHAAQLLLITAIAIACYRLLGFLITMSLLVFALLVVVERRRVLPAAAYGIALTVFAYWLFGIALKAPLEHGLLWF
jgi:tripartite tricarboxylate transporter TctB family protein